MSCLECLLCGLPVKQHVGVNVKYMINFRLEASGCIGINNLGNTFGLEALEASRSYRGQQFLTHNVTQPLDLKLWRPCDILISHRANLDTFRFEASESGWPAAALLVPAF